MIGLTPATAGSNMDEEFQLLFMSYMITADIVEYALELLWFHTWAQIGFIKSELFNRVM